MKILAKQYALSLYQALENKNNAEVKNVIKKFIIILIKNNQLTKIDEIIREFIKIWNREKKIIEAELTGARELKSDVIKNIRNYILVITKANEVCLETKVDKNILGGVIIKYGDKVLDGSLKGRLIDLKSKMIK